MNVNEFAQKQAKKFVRVIRGDFLKTGASGTLRWKVQRVGEFVTVNLWQIGDPDEKIRFQKTYPESELI